MTCTAILDKLAALPQEGTLSTVAWLDDYKGKFTAFKKDFFSTPINSHEGDAAALAGSIKMLLNQFIPDYQHGRFDGAPLTVYVFLKELNVLYAVNNGKPHAELDRLVKEIESMARSRWRKLFIGGVVGTVMLCGIAIPLEYLGHLSAFHEFLTTALFLPAVGLIFTLGIASYSAYQITYDKTVTWRKKLKDNFFLLANMALNVTAYAMLLTAATTTSPLVGTLFMVASVVQVVARVTQLILYDKKLRGWGDDLSGQQLQARHDHEHRKKRNELLIDLAVALAYAGLIVMWCLVPGGIFMSLGIMAVIGGLYLAQWGLEHWNAKRIDAQLQRAFMRLEAPEQKKAAGTGYVPASSPSSGLNSLLEEAQPAGKQAVSPASKKCLSRWGLFKEPLEKQISEAIHAAFTGFSNP